MHTVVSTPYVFLLFFPQAIAQVPEESTRPLNPRQPGKLSVGVNDFLRICLMLGNCSVERYGEVTAHSVHTLLSSPLTNFLSHFSLLICGFYSLISLLYHCLPYVSLSIAMPFFSPLFFPVVPRPGRHRRPMTAPKTQKDKASKGKKVLLTILTVVVLLGILVTAGYFSESQVLIVLSSSKDIRTHCRVASYFHQPSLLG